MKLVQVAEQNKPYYSADYTKGFNDGAKAQYEADKKNAERHGHWKHTHDLYSYPDGNQLFYGKICSVCNNVSPYETLYCMNCGTKMDEGCTPLVADPILTRQTND